MRLLDSKDERTRPYQQGAPLITDHLSDESAAYYDAVKAQLDALGIRYEERPSLVRGLDYYTHTVFELVPGSAEGSQTTLLAGGRYDGLIEQIGGPPTPGIGFGMGIDRFALQLREQGLTEDDEEQPQVIIATLGAGAAPAAGGLAGRLRRAGRVGDARLRRALAQGATAPCRAIRLPLDDHRRRTRPRRRRGHPARHAERRAARPADRRGGRRDHRGRRRRSIY